MGKLNVDLPDDLDEAFRQEIMKRFGYRKGALRKAVIEAIKLWIEKKP